MDYIIIDSNYVFNCSDLNVSPYLLLLGVIALSVAVIYLGFHLAKEPIGLFIEAYNKERESSGRFLAFYELFNHILLFRWPISIVLSLIIVGIFFASNGFNLVSSLVKGGCF